MDCKICNDRGFILVDNAKKQCECQVKKQLGIMLKQLLQYPAVEIEFNKIDTIAVLKSGDSSAFYSFAKSSLICQYIQNNNRIVEYEILSASAIIETYLQQSAQFSNLYTIQSLFIDLSRFYKNSAMGQVIHYILSERNLHNLHTYFYIGNLSAKDCSAIYGSELTLSLFSGEYQTIDISKLSNLLKGDAL